MVCLRYIKVAVEQCKSPYVEIPCPTDLKFRPIVAGPTCPTFRLSHLIDIILKLIPQYTKSYVRDDNDFLTTLHCVLNPNHKCKLVTFDVETLTMI